MIPFTTDKYRLIKNWRRTRGGHLAQQGDGLARKRPVARPRFRRQRSSFRQPASAQAVAIAYDPTRELRDNDIM